MKLKLSSKLICAIMICVIIVINLSMVLAENPVVLSNQSQGDIQAYNDSISYKEYLAQYPDVQRSAIEIPVDIRSQVGGQEVVVNINGEKTGILSKEDDSLKWNIDIPQDGFYNIEIEYCTKETKGSAIERAIIIDGKLPFEEANNISFCRIWSDDAENVQEKGRRFKRDLNDNELVPMAKEIPSWITVYVTDSSGYIDEPLLFYFTKGTHALELQSKRETFIVGAIRLCQSETPPYYRDYIKQYADKDIIKNFENRIQGENPYRKSDPVLIPLTDRTSSVTEPNHPARIRLNTIGGTNWGISGQWIEWQVEVPKDGLYRLGIKYRQNFLSGMTSNRKLLVNGQLPFAEATNITFPYNRQWKAMIIGNKDQDYYIYLEAGKKNTIRLEYTLGESSKLLEGAQEIVRELNEAYTQLVMYAGRDPDLNRDYKIELVLPEVITYFERNLVMLRKLSDDLVAFSGQRGDSNAAVDNLIDILGRMLDDTRDIPKMMLALRDNTGSLADWIFIQSRQPLEIDYITVLGSENKMPNPAGSFFQSILFGIQSFIASFTQDYSLINDNAGDNSINVWLVAGRDQAQLVKNLIINYFTPASGIYVDLKLLNNNGQLLPSIVAGTGPDVSMMSSSTDIMNYALRNGIENIEGYPGFEECSAQFMESALRPFSLEGKVYGLPETQIFPMMFYRKDILAKLGIGIPQTWDELYSVIGELQKNNLQFGFPPVFSGYGMILYQNGEQFYNDDGTGTGLYSNGAVESFKQWTRLFTNYSIPLDYNPANRLRSGEMPLFISDYFQYYNTLSVLAPEIKGLWDFTAVPGIEKADGTIDRSVVSSVLGCSIIKQSNSKEAAWEFIKWWTSAETQARYGKSLECIMGASARYPTANIKAAEQLPWETSEYHSILKQLQYVKGIPEIPGGYSTFRYIDYAFRRVINNYDDEREVIMDYSKMMDEEIKYKRKELGLD